MTRTNKGNETRSKALIQAIDDFNYVGDTHRLFPDGKDSERRDFSRGAFQSHLLCAFGEGANLGYDFAKREAEVENENLRQLLKEARDEIAKAEVSIYSEPDGFKASWMLHHFLARLDQEME